VSTLIVPALEKRAWPTLGPQVCDWIEDSLIHGPGDIRGEPARIDDETRGLIYRMYEVYPRSRPNGGRRRFKRVALSQRKGTAKTEKAAWLAAAELHPDAPVRCDGWRKVGKRWEPVGVGVRDPYIPLVAYTEEQTEELAYYALYVILSEGPLADDFDIGLERIMRADGAGRAVALAGAPNARDGARTTFQLFDESHRMILRRLRDAHTTMLSNIPKRKIADAWTLETTTAFTPGENSVAEATMEYARAVARGEIRDSRLFFFHRQASDKHDLSDDRQLKAALIEASGPASSWSDLEGILSLRQDPEVDLAYWERVWLNRPTQAARQAFSTVRWSELADLEYEPEPGALIVVGVDGARFRDALAMIATEIETGHQWPLGIWERPATAPDDYEHPADEIDGAMLDAFERYDVWRVYIDSQWIDHLFSRWQGRWGGERIIEWLTHRPRAAAAMIASYASAIVGGDLSHDGDPTFAEHIGNSRRRDLALKDDDGKPLWVIEKERRDSPKKIDGAMGGGLSWEARTDAIAADAKKRSREVAFL
jgi:hypothetical protein